LRVGRPLSNPPVVIPLRDRKVKTLLVNAAKRTQNLVRDGWLMLGITLILLLLLELGYRGQRGLRGAVGGLGTARDTAPANPFDATVWAAEYRRDHLQEEATRWAPYVYVRNPTFRGRHIGVDSLGHRVTPLRAPNAPPISVFFFGGSTTFGWFHRDSQTIPTLAAARLQQLVGDRARIDVTNFGVPGHTFTQELFELVLQLRSGARPDVVVFYDGINDVMATVQNGRAGLPQNEWNRQAEFARGRALAAERSPGVANDLRALRRAVMTVGGRLSFAQRLRELAGESRAPSPGDAEPLAGDIVRVFAENARLVEALANDYGFHAIYVWQPALLSSRKRLTLREAWLRDSGTVGDVHMAVPRLIGEPMKRVAGERFIDATTLFDDDTLEIFADLNGHTYERASPRVVDTLMPQLSRAVQQVITRRRID
jgi:lysophospholipase L1-like esterase